MTRRGSAAILGFAVLVGVGAANAQSEDIVSGCFGASGGRGVRVSASGEVYRWTQPRPDEPQRTEQHLGADPERAAQISSELDALQAAVRRSPTSEYTTCFVQRGSFFHSWPWLQGSAHTGFRASELLAKLETLAALTAEAAESASDSIRIGCGGGVTGASSGWRLTAGGQVFRWSGNLGSAREEQLVGTDTGAARDSLAELAAMGFEAIQHRRPSNLTCFLRHRGHEVSWPMSSTDAPPRVLALFDRIEKIGASAEASAKNAPTP